MIDRVLVFNPLPWERSVRGPVGAAVTDDRHDPTDWGAQRHVQDRHPAGLGTLTALDGHGGPLAPDLDYLPPTRVPGYGWTTVDAGRLADPETWSFDERSVVKTDRYRLTFDRDRGGIVAWYDRDHDRGWVDPDPYPLAGFVHERVIDTDRGRDALFHFGDRERIVCGGLDNPPRGWQSDWHARRTGADRVRRHRVYETPDGYHVRQWLDTRVGDAVLTFEVPSSERTVTVEAAWNMGLTTDPEATYLAFPFAVDDPTPRIDVGGVPVIPGKDQLPGTCHDYYSVQSWADVSGPDGGVTVGCPINPLVQFGGFTFADDNRRTTMEDALLLGWVTNNYWETNFRPRQPGAVRARYHLRPHDGFEISRAYEVGETAAHADPVATLVREPASVSGVPSGGQFLDLPSPPVLVEQIRPAAAPGVQDRSINVDPDGTSGIHVQLRNATTSPETARIASGAVTIEAARRVTPIGEPYDGAGDDAHEPGEIRLAGGETAAIRLSVRNT
jgi:hypothetical protein